MPRVEVTIGKNDGGQRLDKFLTKSYPNLPQSMLYKACLLYTSPSPRDA